MPTFGSLFSGFGGLDLGLERAGWECRWQCETNGYARRVLAKHWPGVPCYEDVCKVDGTAPAVDCLAGGFPCQDISTVGKREGIDGSKSGLWGEFARLIGLLRPRVVIVENVADLLVRGASRVFGDLADLGYGFWWHSLQASDFGLPHRRRRVFIVAYPDSSPERFEREWRLPESEIIDWARLVHPGRDGKPDGVPGRVERIRGLGNAVAVPVAEWIGQQAMREYQDG